MKKAYEFVLKNKVNFMIGGAFILGVIMGVYGVDAGLGFND